MELTIPPLTFRTIDVARDADRCAAAHRDACEASFGPGCRYDGRAAYLRWLQEGADVYPDGFVLAYAGRRCVGHLELQVPYGLATGYVNLFYVPPAARGRGYARLLHDYAERYFRSWEATTAELHVGRQNVRAIRFYRRIGYAFDPGPSADARGRRGGDGRPGAAGSSSERMWRMTKRVDAVPV